jgi:hypothetical protein
MIDAYTARRRLELRMRVYSHTPSTRLASRRDDARAILADAPVSTRRRKGWMWTPEQDAALCRAIAAGVPLSGLPDAIREHRETTKEGCRARFRLLRKRLRKREAGRR